MRAASVVVVVVVAVIGGAVLPAAATVGAFGLDAAGDAVGPVSGEPGTAAPSTADAGSVAESDDGNVSPGERLAGVVGVQGEELDSEVTERRFAAALNASGSDRGKAKVVAGQVEELRERLDRLQDRREELRSALKDGSISPGEFRAQMAGLAANLSATERMLNASAATAATLPADVLNETGVNASAIQELRENASELGGPEVAEIARSIAGNDTGKRLGPPADRGPPEGVPGNGADPGPPDDNETGPPEDAGNGNETGPPEDAGNGNETGPPEDAGPPEDDNDNGTESPGEGGEGQPSEGSPGDNAGSGNESDGGQPDETPGNGSGGDDNAGGGNGNGDNGGSDKAPALAVDETGLA